MSTADRKPVRTLAVFSGRNPIGVLRMRHDGKVEAITRGRRLNKRIGTFETMKAAANALAKATQPPGRDEPALAVRDIVFKSTSDGASRHARDRQ